MATAVVMPKQGQSVESCLIVGWKKGVGDQVTAGEILAEVETDKALVEVETYFRGRLALFFEAGDDVPVLTNIAAIGQPGEDVSMQWNQRSGGFAAEPGPHQPSWNKTAAKTPRKSLRRKLSKQRRMQLVNITHQEIW